MTRGLLDDIADNVASLEAMVTTEATSTTPNIEGNYHITVLTIALKQLTDLFVRVCCPEKCNHAGEIAFLLGNGYHWQALVKEGNHWFIKDKFSFEVNDLQNYLYMASRRGIVLALIKNVPPEGDMDWEATSTTTNNTMSRKRTLDEAANPDTEATPRIACQPIEITNNEEPEEPDKKARALEGCNNTQELLQDAQQAFEAIPAPPIIDLANSMPQETWHQIQVGVTPMLTNETGDKFKCVTCDLQRPTALGVATHYGRYCSKKAVKEEDAEEKEGDHNEDII